MNALRALMLCTGISCTMVAMIQQPRKNNFSGIFKSLAATGFAGGLDVVAGRPCDYAKMAMVQKIPLSYNPSIWYRGSLMNIISLVPATAAQGVFSELFAPYMSPVAAYSLAGGFSTIVACPADFIVFKMQLLPENKKACMVRVMQEIYTSNGLKEFYRGATAIGVREWGFTLAYKKYLHEMATFAERYIKKPWNEVAALAVGGPLFSCITHPMETIRMAQQDSSKKTIGKVLHEMRLSEQGLMKSLFAGYIGRALRCTIALAALVKAHDVVTLMVE